MALPAGITTCTYIAGPAGTIFGSPAKVSVTITPAYGGTAKRLIWEPTGWVMPSFPETVPEDDDGIVQFDLPHVDQAGWVDPAGDAITMWGYRASVKIQRTGGSRESLTYDQFLQPLVGEDNVDLDLVAGTESAAPVVNVSMLRVVNHGTDPNLPRPDATVVIWAGTVEPVNADNDYDLWVGPEGA